jgi:hypothetical protein
MDDKMYRLIWDETIRYEAFVKAANVEEAREAWGTGIEGQYLDSHTAIPMVLEV